MWLLSILFITSFTNHVVAKIFSSTLPKPYYCLPLASILLLSLLNHTNYLALPDLYMVLLSLHIHTATFATTLKSFHNQLSLSSKAKDTHSYMTTLYYILKKKMLHCQVN
jgi:hypothetical protein